MVPILRAFFPVSGPPQCVSGDAHLLQLHGITFGIHCNETILVQSFSLPLLFGGHWPGSYDNQPTTRGARMDDSDNKMRQKWVLVKLFEDLLTY